MNLSHRCIFCGEEQVASTMNFIIDTKKYEIGLCSKCGEEATMGKVKAQLEKELGELDQLKKRAELFGMELVPKGQVPPPSAPLLTPQVSKPLPVRTQVAKSPQPIKSQMANPNQNSAFSELSKQAREAAIKEAARATAIQLQRINTDKGDIVIPKSSASQFGDTNIQFIKTSDQDVQKKFKNLSRGSMADQGPDYRNQYDVQDCPDCRASGVDEKGSTCKTCKGKMVL